MPKYRAKNYLFIAERLIEPGEEFESSLEPGKNWEPLNPAAKKAYEEMFGKRGAMHSAAEQSGILRQGTQPSAIMIPDDWETLSKQRRRAIGLKLGALPTCTAEEADSFIAAEMGRRKQLVA